MENQQKSHNNEALLDIGKWESLIKSEFTDITKLFLCQISEKNLYILCVFDKIPNDREGYSQKIIEYLAKEGIVGITAFYTTKEWETLEKIKSHGASSILVLPIEKMLV